MKIIKLILFYIASFTWGALMSIIGLFVGLALTITGHLPKVFHGRLYWEVGNNWGGFTLGCFIICSKDSTDLLRQHEAGHSLQNIILGPFFPIVIGIPSALRYWLREMKTQKDKTLFGFIIWLVGFMVGAIIIGLSASTGLNSDLHTIFLNIRALHIFVDILGKLILFYGCGLGVWLMFFETPRYTNDKNVPYDSFWPEGWATKWGAKYFA